MTLLGRTDLFAAVQAYGWGGVPCDYWLHPDLTPAQRADALALVQHEYDPRAYGTSAQGNKISVWSAE